MKKFHTIILKDYIFEFLFQKELKRFL